mmetsp:Transcript_14236/g.33085  ORF Transcript_14236/g.33085 Transcript_14236/m.33085 type:complete len:135 (+) Transcript_14236:3024-3428(+)
MLSLKLILDEDSRRRSFCPAIVAGAIYVRDAFASNYLLMICGSVRNSFASTVDCIAIDFRSKHSLKSNHLTLGQYLSLSLFRLELDPKEVAVAIGESKERNYLEVSEMVMRYRTKAKFQLFSSNRPLTATTILC